MTESTFPGFGAAVKRLPVPAPLLSSLLAEITDVAELKCTLRFLWYEDQESVPRRVPIANLRVDSVLLDALGSEDEIDRGIALAVERGTLIEAGGWLLLHTPQNQRAAERLGIAPTLKVAAASSVRPDIFQLYEQYVGFPFNPIITDELRAVEEEYPYDWIADAIREALENNVRSWRYVVKVLERWKREGRGTRSRGKSGGHTETLTADQILARLHRS